VHRIQSTGAVLRTQSPVVRHINDDPRIWARLWRKAVRLGIFPYYMFVERDTGPKNYFEIPLERALEIYQGAYRSVSGLGKTARGPVMSAFFGKVRLIGVTEVRGRRVFALEYIQARDPEFVGKPFFAEHDPLATWFDQLVPAFESDIPFFIHDSLADTDSEESELVAY